MSTTENASTALVPIDHYAVLKSSPEDLREILMANVGTAGMSDFDLDRLRVPAGGGLTWEVPGLAGTEPAKSVEGVVVSWHDARAFWESGLETSGGGAPPDCSSSDGITGQGAPGGACASCPQAQFGSAPPKEGKAARGQACKLSKLLFLVQPDTLLPLVVVGPPSSLRNLKCYMLRLSSQAIPIHGVVTALELEPATSRDGHRHSVIVPRFIGKLGAEVAQRMRAYGETVAKVFSRMGVSADDVTWADESEQ
jgi:hypothetical protein